MQSSLKTDRDYSMIYEHNKLVRAVFIRVSKSNRFDINYNTRLA